MRKELLNTFDKELLLKDLCGRLPYGVKVLCLRDFNRKWYNLKMVDVEDNEVYLTTTDKSYTNRYVEIEEVKPYLFPLSSMTEEQCKELEEIDPEFYSLICSNGEIYVSMDLRGYDWLNKNHFDYRGLIPKGLAIDATGLNIY